MTPDEIKQRLAATGLRVKPLEWTAVNDTKTQSGPYTILETHVNEFMLLRNGDVIGEYSGGSARYFTKKNAQADYERHIYETLMEDTFDLGEMDTFNIGDPNDPT